jgi:hypothetical protein
MILFILQDNFVKFCYAASTFTIITNCLMFVPCIIRRSRNNQHYAELYQSFIQYTGSYMFQQQSVTIRELLGSVWVTWNAYWIGGISYNVRLYGLCARLRHTGHINTHHMINHSGVPRNFFWEGGFCQEFFFGGGVNKFGWGQRADRTKIWGW